MSEQPPCWREYRSSIGSRWMIPLCWLPWACKCSAHWLKQWAFLDVLDRLGKLTILIAVITWLWGIPARRRAEENQRQAKIYQAWQVINTAHGKPGSGGREGALYDLVAEDQSLAYVDLSHANLTGLKLPGQNLEQANFQQTKLSFSNLNTSNLQYANLKHAELVNTRLKEANLQAADLQGAHMLGARLQGAKLGAAVQAGLRRRDVSKPISFELTNLRLANLAEAHLDGADLNSAQFQEADLSGAVLQEADLRGAVLRKANLSRADFEMADLRRVDLEGVRNWKEISSLELANIHGVRNAPQGFRKWAVEQKGAVNIENDLKWMNMKQKAKSEDE